MGFVFLRQTLTLVQAGLELICSTCDSPGSTSRLLSYRHKPPWPAGCLTVVILGAHGVIELLLIVQVFGGGRLED